MTPGRLFHLLLVRLLPILLLGLLALQAMAQADPPGRVARINHAQGSVVFSPAGDNEWTDAVLNRPLTRGDRLWTDRGSRADVQVGSSAVRLDGQTHLEILALDDQSAQLSVTQGTVYVRVRSLPEGEIFEVDTPNLAYRAAYPGDYRIDVDAARATTRVTIHSGTGAVYGENGQALPLGGGQQITFRGRSLGQLNAQEAPPQDGFDRWAAERNRLEDQSISARFVPREVVGYQQLDAHGKWAHDLTHGVVWIPHAIPANWAPYRHGHWEWISPWGWTWIDDAAWGFAPFHYGRWAMIESRWAWVPGRLGLRPMYAPALVAFIGGGQPGVAWFPLAPGEAWQPGYRASPVYISSVNPHIAVQANAGYAHQRSVEALTAISAEDFHRGKPMRGGWLRLAANVLTNAQIVPPPPMPERSEVIAQQPAAPSGVAPPPAAEIRQVIATATPASGAEPAALSRREREAARREAARRQAQEQAQAKAAQAQAQQLADADRMRHAAEQENARREKAQRARQAKDAKREAAVAQAAPARTDSQAAHAQTAKPVQAPATTAATPATQPTPRAEQARASEPEKREQAAARREQTRREQQASVLQARRVQAAQRAEQAKREEIAVRAEQARREQATRRAEQAKQQVAKREADRREQLARRAEQSRREEQAKRETQAKREEQVKREAQAKREAQVKREAQAKREALAKRGEQLRREAHAQRAEQARRAAERDAQALRAQREEQARLAAEREAQALREQRAEREAQALREQRAEREAQALREQRARRDEQARRDAEERQQAQRDAWQRQQQALAEQWRREQQQWEQQQREQTRRRPELRPDPRPDPRDDRRVPEVWQRGFPILNPGRTS